MFRHPQASHMNGVIQFAAKALVPVVVAVCFALARKYLKPSARLSEMRLSALDARFQQTKWVVGVSMIAVAVVFAWTTHHLLVSLNRYLGTGSTLLWKSPISADDHLRPSAKSKTIPAREWSFPSRSRNPSISVIRTAFEYAKVLHLPTRIHKRECLGDGVPCASAELRR